MEQINTVFAAPSNTTSGIKVLDRAVLIMLTIADRPRSLSELCTATGLPRATAHRLATALETHHILSRTQDGKWAIGAVLTSLGASGSTKLIDAATPIMTALMDETKESVQLYQLAGATRVCIAAQEPAAGLQNTVPIGSRLPLSAGSAAKVFLAYSAPTLRDKILADNAHFTLTDLEQVRKQGYAESIAEREAGLASLSAPVFDSEGLFIAALSISGPAERLKPTPATLWSQQLTKAAAELSNKL
ncbi:IclR-family transcriptional regulator [Corynebacterium kutscheri]|uniref:IclR-family transcriptional regulator n=1 Tax=Corynebacterium kutscheri TaxID=35755 RepID=A0A0F6TDC6_9CORY|nr:IclR family transcriptional regulator [Corynebacterium kutscheri]AKE41064.1 transcriptional regulator, IclR family [Corynebacterium kutscheri]VEH06954.1 IclR-family transcriptional regulator [Corynebacterium kutscheri]VEH09368.1 IclR-family transcriptional regulator [Corynebacterium kutscheri]VEH79449.1 IclR-family transcriptional regulator [Corynebacterium kutscheri]